MNLPVRTIFFLTLIGAVLLTNSFEEAQNKTRQNATNGDLVQGEESDQTRNQTRPSVSTIEATKITQKAQEEKHNPVSGRATPLRNKFRDEFLRKDLSGKHHLELNEISDETKNRDEDSLDLKVIFGGPYENLGSRVRREARKADNTAREFSFRTTDSEEKNTILIIMVVLVCLLITYYYCICCVSIYYFKCQYCFDFDCYKRPGYPCPGKSERACC